MNISSNNELYNAADVLIADLEKAGHPAEAANLKLALSFSTLAGELLGKLRQELTRLRRRAILVQRIRARRRTKEMINYIDSVLQ